ncbi:hypothetical protein CLI85_12580 [Tannerella forsythia]|nr:hypothetical protein CLI85_12580 [Tannerella forsythia]
MSGAKENQAVRSEASYLIFRPASVARACEAHEALTFGLLLGQAKSNRKEILRFALNDKLIVNCQWLIVMPGTRNPNAEEHPPSPLQRGERAKAKGGCYPFKGGMRCGQPSANSVWYAV